MRLTPLTLAAAALALILPAFAATPDAPSRQNAPQPSIPTLQVYSRETLVDVTVTDAHGRPVRGLKQSDFTITEDDAPQSVRSFQEFGTRTNAAAHSLPKLPSNVYTNLQPASGPLNVILLDAINDTTADVISTTKFVQKMPPGTQIALLALGDKLTVLQGPTTDAAPLLKLLNTGQARVKPFAAMADPCGTQDAMNWATIDQLDQVAAYLSGIKGRKNLLWVGPGIPRIVFPDTLFSDAHPGARNTLCLRDVTTALRKTYELLTNAEITVYPIDAAGVRKLGVDQLAMEAVAEATGGVAYYERNDVDRLIAAAVSTAASYYTLSYVPPSVEFDGRHHAISIKVNRPGIHLIYRREYYTDDPALLAHTTASVLTGKPAVTPSKAQKAGDPLVAALTLTMPPATQLLFDVKAEPSTAPPSPSDPPVLGALNPKLSRAPLARYSFLFAVPTSQLAFARAADGTFTGSLEFDVAAFDPDGRLVTIRSQTMKLPLTGDEYRQFAAAPFKFFQQVDLPPGQFTLRVGILDGVSNKVGTVDIPVTVTKK